MELWAKSFSDIYINLLNPGNAGKKELLSRGEYGFECKAAMKRYQVKKLTGFKDDPEYAGYHASTSKEYEAELQTIRRELTSRGISFREEKNECISDERDKHRTLEIQTRIRFSVSPEKRAEIIKNQLAADTQKVVSECKVKAGPWYARFSALDVVNAIAGAMEDKINTGLSERFALLQRNGYYDGYFESLRVPMSWGLSGLTLDLSQLKTSFPFCEQVSFRDLGYQDLEKEEQKAALQAIVTERLTEKLVTDLQVDVCGLLGKDADPNRPAFPTLIIFPRIIYKPDNSLRSWS